MNKEVMILTGTGQIGMAIARRMGYGKKIVVGDRNLKSAEAVCRTLNEAGFDAIPIEMDLFSRESILNLIAVARKHGEISTLVMRRAYRRVQRATRCFLQKHVRQMPGRTPRNRGRGCQCCRTTYERQRGIYHGSGLSDRWWCYGIVLLWSVETVIYCTTTSKTTTVIIRSSVQNILSVLRI